jgi:L-fuculose-phosphate aldolase
MTMLRIYRYRMTTTSGGNLSILDQDGSIWITPARVDKGSLTPGDIVRVWPDGRQDGAHPPSSELPFHQEIYRRRPDLRAIVHAHPGALVAFSICRKLPDTRVQSHVHAVCGKLAIAPYACPGTQALGDNIAATFASGADCVLLENHGVVVGGSDLRDAFQRFETLEFVAQTLIRASVLGTPQVLSTEALAVDTMPKFNELQDRPPTNTEKELRSEICRYLQRAYQQRLLISTAGAFSCRLDREEFLITPRRRDRLAIEPPGIVRVRNKSCSIGQRPSRTAMLHARIYAQDSQVGAVISAQPAYASAFCITAERLNSHTIPESYLLLQEVPKLPFLRIVEDAEKIASAISLKNCPAILIANEAAVVVGKTILEAFDRLEVLEATAEAVVLARAVGPLAQMPLSAIDELRRVFFKE